MHIIENVFCNISDFIIGPKNYSSFHLNKNHDPFISPTQYIILCGFLFLYIKWFSPTKSIDVDQQKTIQAILNWCWIKIMFLMKYILILFCFISTLLLSFLILPIIFSVLIYRHYILQKIKVSTIYSI